MMDESYAPGKIKKELDRLRQTRPDEETTRREWAIADAKYRERIAEGTGDAMSGAVILTFYVKRQAYFRYAMERGFSLEVRS